MKRPKQEPPLDVSQFLDLIDLELYPVQCGGIAHVGDSTTAVLLVFGPDADEIGTFDERLTLAKLDSLHVRRMERME